MTVRSRKAAFLQQLQECIDRYKPLLEQEFQITLGSVAGRQWHPRDRLTNIYNKADELLRRDSIKRRGRPPSRLRLLLHSVEKRLTWAPAYLFLSLRFWFADLLMKWVDDPPTVLVSLSGWSEVDYQRNSKRLDQWTVHELAHGVWSQLAKDGAIDHDRQWRIWNEGFSHYLADVHFRSAYPPHAVVDDQWSDERQRGKQLVTDVVRRHGNQILREIPKHWREFSTEAV